MSDEATRRGVVLPGGVDGERSDVGEAFIDGDSFQQHQIDGGAHESAEEEGAAYIDDGGFEQRNEDSSAYKDAEQSVDASIDTGDAQQHEEDRDMDDDLQEEDDDAYYDYNAADDPEGDDESDDEELSQYSADEDDSYHGESDDDESQAYHGESDDDESQAYHASPANDSDDDPDDDDLLKRGVASVLVVGDEKIAKLDAISAGMLRPVETFARLYKSKADLRVLRVRTLRQGLALTPPALLCKDHRGPGTYNNLYEFDTLNPPKGLPAGKDGSYGGQTSRSCRQRQKDHISTAKKTPSPRNQSRHSLAILQATDSLSLVGLAVEPGSHAIDAFANEIVAGYGTDFGLKSSILRVAAFLSAAEPVETAIHRHCRIGFRYNRALDVILGEPQKGTVGLNGNKCMSNAVRSFINNPTPTYDDPEDPEQDVVVNNKLLRIRRASKAFRARVTVLALVATGFNTSIYINPASEKRRNTSALIPACILRRSTNIGLYSDDVEDLGLPERGPTRQTIKAFIRIRERTDGGHVAAMGTLQALLFLEKYELVLSVGDRSITLPRERHTLTKLLCELLHALASHLGTASPQDLARADIAALVKDDVSLGWSTRLFQQSLAAALGHCRSPVRDFDCKGTPYHSLDVLIRDAEGRPVQRQILFPYRGTKVGKDHDGVIWYDPVHDTRKYAIVPRSKKGAVSDDDFRTLDDGNHENKTWKDVEDRAREIVGKSAKQQPTTLEERVALVLGAGLPWKKKDRLFDRQLQAPAGIRPSPRSPILLHLVPKDTLVEWLCGKTGKVLLSYNCTQKGTRHGSAMMKDLQAYLAKKESEKKEESSAGVLGSNVRAKEDDQGASGDVGSKEEVDGSGGGGGGQADEPILRRSKRVKRS